jgi:hypothetical protein
MRALEVYHALRLPPGAWAVLRLDGRGLSRLTDARFDKPFDAQFHDAMVRTAQAVLEDLLREGYNPKLSQRVVNTRRRIKVNRELPMGEEYVDFLRRLMQEDTAGGPCGGGDS